MDTSPVQYVKTSDGISIAYLTMGGGPGPPVVWVDLPSQLQFDQELNPGRVSGFEFMAKRSTLVRYDHRGFGLSDRNITKFPLDDMVKDLEAVVDKLALETFMLVTAAFTSTLVAVTYAASHPERVARLAITALAHVPPEVYDQYQALILSNNDWRFVSEAISRLVHGWDDEQFSRSEAAWYRESANFETFKEFWRDIEKWDVRGLLPAIEAPTLITAMPLGLYTVEQGREMASLLPHAQLLVAKGVTYNERLTSFQAVWAFLYGPAAARPPRKAQPAPSGTAIILFADIVDSTALTERLGDAAFRDKARDLDTSLRKIIRDNGGTPIDGKLLGDGVLAVFTSARQAIEAALACAQAGDDSLPLHLGLHAGDVIREENNVYGGAVNLAARIAALSAPGELLVSDTVRSLARTSAGVSFEDRGEQSLKGIEDPVRVYEVRRRD